MSPSAGSSAKAGDDVVVSFQESNPPPADTATVPSILGMTYAGAKSTLAQADLSMEPKGSCSAEADDWTSPGCVVGQQDPVLGAQVGRGTSVAAVFDAPEPTPTPTKTPETPR